MYRNEDVLQSEDCSGLIDTHCHLDLEPLRSNLDEVVSSACRAGVTRFVVPGVHPDGWVRLADLPKRHKGIFPAFGIHPMHANLVDDSRLGELEQIAATGVAIGETGLDPAYSVSLELQERAFREQLRLAVLLDLPVLVHCRQAFHRTLQVLQEERVQVVGGIMHAFSGSVEMAREFIRLGFVISVSAMVTRENAVKPLRLVRELPLECLVLETDAPDMTPHCYKGEWNQPAYMVETLLTVAAIKAVRPEDVVRSSRSASLRVLNRMPVP